MPIEDSRPSTRKAAKKNGEKTYIGKSCPKGHSGLRYTAHGECVACANEYSASDAKKEYDTEYWDKNRDRILDRSKDYYKKNSERSVSNAKRWAEQNPEKRKAIRAKWKANNRHKVAADAQRRSAAKLNATPIWADHVAIGQYYLIAGFLTAELGISFEVDHRVPLRSSLVCGFHAHTNLGISMASLNRSKNNRWWPDMP